ncbi:hypothetical protein SAMN04488096_102362 [Mesonia phycicola]|uniref:Uncharacterized protein n=1 Tax=Mesonia phycicola TaxID=579105 RepID=A0A1M6C4I8_9FLAO|nr:hypothetical protein [Mesonia phycicola]SHI55937.1 hypothetical protein SAMN04488096_102362 [Mesonia phycicola]
MKLTHLIILSFIFLARGFGEGLPMQTTLDSSVNESSGLLMIDGKLITHNDSDETPELFEINKKTGAVERSVYVKNVKNNDWEDIAADKDYIYIGDFGNNLGNRENLMVYKISKKEYHNTENDTVVAEKIEFNYATQTNYNTARYSSNFDAEALISYKDNLYIFTKNWDDKNTDIYKLSKEPGNYTAEKIDTIETNGLITGAEYDEKNDRVLLVGSGIPTPFLIELKNFSNGKFSNGKFLKHDLEPQLGASIQIEGITMTENNACYLSAEKSITGASALYKFDFDNSVNKIEM